MQDTQTSVELFTHPLCPVGQSLEIALYATGTPFALTLSGAQLSMPKLCWAGTEKHRIEEGLPLIMSPPDPDWFTIADQLNAQQHGMIIAEDQDRLTKASQECAALLSQLDQLLTDIDCRAGRPLRARDCLLAPFFIRQIGLDAATDRQLFGQLPRVAAFGQMIIRERPVRLAIRPNFPSLFMDFIESSGGRISQL